MTPGRKPSISASALAISAIASSMPARVLRSSATERRPRAVISKRGSPVSSRSGPSSSRSMRSTSAPRSASSMPQNGTGPLPASSRTLIPESGPRQAPSVMAHHTLRDERAQTDDDGDDQQGDERRAVHGRGAQQEEDLVLAAAPGILGDRLGDLAGDHLDRARDDRVLAGLVGAVRRAARRAVERTRGLRDAVGGAARIEAQRADPQRRAHQRGHHDRRAAAGQPQSEQRAEAGKSREADETGERGPAQQRAVED